MNDEFKGLPASKGLWKCEYGPPLEYFISDGKRWRKIDLLKLLNDYELKEEADEG